MSLSVYVILLFGSVTAGAPVRSPLEVSARVLSVNGQSVALSADLPGRPILPGMVMTILNDDEPLATVEVQTVRNGRAEGVLADSASQSALSPGLKAVAPCPIPITGTDGAIAHLALPLDHGLGQGALLRVERDGVGIGSATLVVEEDQPPRAIPAEETGRLRPGDVCYAVSGAAPSHETAPPPPATATDALVTSVRGDQVFFWAASADALAASTSRLSIIRDGQCIAIVRLHADGPLEGTAEATRPGDVIMPGDHARRWAEGDRIPQAPTPLVPPAARTTAASSTTEALQSDATARVTVTQVDIPPKEDTRAVTTEDRPDKHWTSPPQGLSLSGPTGILRTPTAEVLSAGVVRMGRVFASPDLDRTFPGSRSRSQFTLGAVPRLELGIAHYARFDEDLTLHAKVQLLPESRRWPALSIGTMDERAAYALEPTRFLVASKRFMNGRLRGTLGYAEGGLTGPFGGIEATLTPGLTLLGEYDTDGLNFGLRATPGRRIQIDLADLDGTLGGQVSCAFVMGEGNPPAPLVLLPRPSEPCAPQGLADRLQKAVCALGMENVCAEVGEGPFGQAAMVSYENRRYLHDELEALGRVLAAAVRELPPGIQRLTVIVTKSRVSVLRVTTHPDDYVRFLRGDLDPARYVDMLRIDHGGASPIPRAEVSGRSDLGNPTRYTADLAMTPVVRTLIGTEDPTPADPNATQSLAVRLSLRPDFYLNLGQGLDLRYSHGVHVAGTLGGGLDPYFAADAVHVAYTFRPFNAGLARVAAGDFLGGRRGGVAEAVVPLGGDRLVLRGLAGHLRDRRFFDAGPGHWVYVGDVRYRIPSADIIASGTFGRYIDDDVGFTLGLRKHFRDTELDMQFRHSNYGNVLLLAGTVPIGPREWPRPEPLRLRLGERLRVGQRVLLPESGKPGLVTAASLVANSLEEFDLTDTLLNRDRLNAAYIGAHLDSLRRAAASVVQRPFDRSPSH